MALQVKRRADTATNWSSTNPTLAQGEIGVDLTNNDFKIGTGSTSWNSLSVAPTNSPTQTVARRSLGDGSDGTVSLSSGTTTLTRDMYYNNLTISGTAQVVTNGYRVFIKNILDLTNAPVGAINWNGLAGGNASNATGGTPATAQTSQTLGAGAQGGTGATATTGAGGTGTASSATNGQGGTGGGCGIAGANGVNAAGAAAAGAVPAGTQLWAKRFTIDFVRGITLQLGGVGGRGGSSGAGDNTNNGGGGGAGGNAGGVVAIYAYSIVRSASTPSGVIQANGGMGGNGGTNSTGIIGGGSGGGGGGGGWVYLAYNYLFGPQVSAFITTDGGMGGTGGNGFGTTNPTLSGGGGGYGGKGGRINVFNITTLSGVERFGDNTDLINPETDNGVTAFAALGIDGGSGGMPGLCRVTI